MLDIKTIFVLLATSHLLGAIVIGILAFNNPGLKGVKEWAIGRLLVFISIVAFFMRVYVSEGDFFYIGNLASILVGNFLLCLGLFFALQGNYKINNRIPVLNYRMFSLLLVLHLVLLTYLTPVEIQNNYRIVLVGIINFLFMVLLVQSLWTKKQEDKLYSKNILMTAYTMVGLSEGVKAMLIILGVIKDTQFTDNNPITAILIFVSCCGSVLTSVGYLSLVVENLNKTLVNLSEKDPLTNIFNRLGFFKKANEILQHNQNTTLNLSVLFLDIDHFKAINDTYGHETGDRVLKQVSSITTLSLPDEHCLARFGGEEFVIMLPGKTEEDAITIADTICMAIKHMEPIDMMSPGELTCSIGVAISNQDQPVKLLNELLLEADCAMYHAKHTGRDRVCLFTPDMKLNKDCHCHGLDGTLDLNLTSIQLRS